VLRSEIAEEDKEELRNRFRGNLSRTGAVGVISSDDGADFVDTAASPRDAAYQAMRTISKEEILAAFGVPESVIGNASGRTFANAAEEGKVFWMETMGPHLQLIARSFDRIDDTYFVDFDTSGVPIMILAKQERERHNLTEFQQGLISVNEYRESSARKKVVSELADSLLSNPNLTPVGNTEKPMVNEEQGAAGAPPMPGAPPMEGAPPLPGAPPAGGGSPMTPEQAARFAAGAAVPPQIEAGVPLQQQATAAMQEQVTEFSPEQGAFVPFGSVQGTQQIELPASEVPSELEELEEDEKSLPLDLKIKELEKLLLK